MRFHNGDRIHDLARPLVTHPLLQLLPPKLPDDPVAALESTHSQLGIHVDPETTTPLWNGERFDVGYAIYTLWRP